MYNDRANQDNVLARMRSQLAIKTGRKPDPIYLSESRLCLSTGPEDGNGFDSLLLRIQLPDLGKHLHVLQVQLIF
jgi:hypothetical protein